MTFICLPTKKSQNWPLNASTPAAAHMLFMALAVTAEVLAPWINRLGLELAGVVTAGEFTTPDKTFAAPELAPPGAESVRRAPPDNWVVPAEAIVFMMLPPLALVRTSSLVGVVGATLFVLAVFVEPVEAAVTAVPTLVLPLPPAVPLAALAPSLEFFNLTLLRCTESLGDFGIPLAFWWPEDKPVFSGLGSCLIDIFVGRLFESEDTAVPELAGVLPQFDGVGPFMWVWIFDGDAYRIVRGFVTVLPPLVVVIVVVTTRFMHVLPTPLPDDEDTWFAKSLLPVEMPLAMISLAPVVEAVVVVVDMAEEALAVVVQTTSLLAAVLPSTAWGL